MHLQGEHFQVSNGGIGIHGGRFLADFPRLNRFYLFIFTLGRDFCWDLERGWCGERTIETFGNDLGLYTLNIKLEH